MVKLTDIFPVVSIEERACERYARALEDDYEVSTKLVVGALDMARDLNIAQLTLRPRNPTNGVRSIRITGAPDDPSTDALINLKIAIGLHIEGASDEDQIVIPFDVTMNNTLLEL